MAKEDEGLLDQSEIEALFNTLEGAPPGAATPKGEATEKPDVPAAPAPAQELNLKPFTMEELTAAPHASGGDPDIGLIADVDLNVRVELGRTRMYIEEVLKLRDGSIIPLDKLAGDPVDVYVNGQLMARGEVLVLNDNFCVRISEIVGEETQQEREAS